MTRTQLIDYYRKHLALIRKERPNLTTEDYTRLRRTALLDLRAARSIRD